MAFFRTILHMDYKLTTGGVMNKRILSTTFVGLLVGSSFMGSGFAEDTSSATTNSSQNVVVAPSDDIATEKRFKKLDVNGDGKVSKEEAQSGGALSGKFANIDENGDGNLSVGEFAQFDKLESPVASQPGAASQQGGGSGGSISSDQPNKSSSQSDDSGLRVR